MADRRRPGARTDNYRYAGVGVQFAATIGVFGALGYWLDGKLGSGPWLLIVGVFAGFALGLVSMVSKLSPRDGKRSPGTTTEAAQDKAPHDPTR